MDNTQADQLVALSGAPKKSPDFSEPLSIIDGMA